jgi:hypothetical protein
LDVGCCPWLLVSPIGFFPCRAEPLVNQARLLSEVTTRGSLSWRAMFFLSLEQFREYK